MILLSVVIITFNEERNIGRCIDSIKDIADDIVVIDSFSTDKTKEICLEKDVNFIEHTFLGHVEQKNYALTKAKYSYVLSLDADEAVDNTLKKSILVIKNNWTHDGYYMNRLTNYCGKWIYYSGWYPDKKLRLWDTKKGIWKGTNPHDCYSMEENTKIGYLKGDILHYSYYNLKEHISVAYKYSDISAKELLKSKAKVGFIKLFLSPFWRFIGGYFFKKGFKDGFFGLLIAVTSAYAVFLKYALVKYYKYREKTNN